MEAEAPGGQPFTHKELPRGITAPDSRLPLQQKLTAGSVAERIDCTDIGLLEGARRCGTGATTRGGSAKTIWIGRSWGERACGCGGAGAPCPACNKVDATDPDDVPAMPAGFKPDLS